MHFLFLGVIIEIGTDKGVNYVLPTIALIISFFALRFTMLRAHKKDMDAKADQTSLVKIEETLEKKADQKELEKTEIRIGVRFKESIEEIKTLIENMQRNDKNSHELILKSFNFAIEPLKERLNTLIEKGAK